MRVQTRQLKEIRMSDTLRFKTTALRGTPVSFSGPDQEQALMWAIEALDLFQRYDACNGVWQ